LATVNNISNSSEDGTKDGVKISVNWLLLITSVTLCEMGKNGVQINVC